MVIQSVMAIVVVCKIPVLPVQAVKCLTVAAIVAVAAMEFAARAEPARVVAAGVDLTRAVPAHPAAAGAEDPVVAVASAAGPQAEAAAAAAEEGNSLTCNTIKILNTTLYIIAWCFFFKDGTVFDLVLMTLNKQNLSLSNH